MESKIKVRKTYEEVADYLRNQIISGVYKIGEKLPTIKELAVMFGVGQSTIREAISALKTIGLVNIRQGEGIFVASFEAEEFLSSLENIRPLTAQDMICLIEARKILEAGMVQLAAERRTKEDVRSLEEALSELEEAHVLNQKDQGYEADRKFHFAVYEACHNPILLSIMQSLSQVLERGIQQSRHELDEKKAAPQNLLKHHRNIYEAILCQNKEYASKAIEEHFSSVEEIMVKEMVQQNKKQKVI